MDAEEVQLAGDGELLVRSPYVAWNREDTKVINYVLARGDDPGPLALRPNWRTAPNARTARAEVVKFHGRILEENAAGDHIFFRVHKERK